MPYGAVDLRTGHGQLYTNLTQANTFKLEYPHAIVEHFPDTLTVEKFLRYKQGQATNRAKRPLVVHTYGLVLELRPDAAGKGACVCQIVDKDEECRFSRAYRLTIQERMDLMAVIMALETIQDKDKARPTTVFTDSRFVLEATTTPHTMDLWQDLETLRSTFDRLSFELEEPRQDLHQAAVEETDSYWQYNDHPYEIMVEKETMQSF